MSAGNATAAELAEVAALNHIVNVAQIYVACTTSILIWDWLACLPQEWKYIWKSNWTPIKFLYIMVRYYTFLVLVVTDVWFFASWSEAACSANLRILPGIAVVIDLCVEGVLAFRVWALYGRSTRIGLFILMFTAAFLGVMIAVPILAFDYIHLPSFPGPCLVTGKASSAGPKFIIAFYASPMTYDFVMTGLTVWRGIKMNKTGSASTLMNRFIKDGLFYFAAITSLNLINVIFFVQGNTLIQSINAPMSIQLSSVLSCRLILNLRASRESQPTVQKFSNTMNRWVSDFQHDESGSAGHSNTIALASRNGTSSVGPVLPIGKDAQPSTNGIVVHWEQEVNYSDQWNKKDAEVGSDRSKKIGGI